MSDLTVSNNYQPKPRAGRPTAQANTAVEEHWFNDTYYGTREVTGWRTVVGAELTLTAAEKDYRRLFSLHLHYVNESADRDYDAPAAGQAQPARSFSVDLTHHLRAGLNFDYQGTIVRFQINPEFELNQDRTRVGEGADSETTATNRLIGTNVNGSLKVNIDLGDYDLRPGLDFEYRQLWGADNLEAHYRGIDSEKNKLLLQATAKPHLRFHFRHLAEAEKFLFGEPFIGLGFKGGHDSITPTDRNRWLGKTDPLRLAASFALGTDLVIGRERRLKLPVKWEGEFGNYSAHRLDIGLKYAYDKLELGAGLSGAWLDDEANGTEQMSIGLQLYLGY